MPPKCNEERGHYVEKFGGSRCLYFVVPPCLERSRSDGFLRTGDERARDENMGDDARRHQACYRDFYSRGRGEVPGRSAKDALRQREVDTRPRNVDAKRIHLRRPGLPGPL